MSLTLDDILHRNIHTTDLHFQLQFNETKYYCTMKGEAQQWHFELAFKDCCHFRKHLLRLLKYHACPNHPNHHRIVEQLEWWFPPRVWGTPSYITTTYRQAQLQLIFRSILKAHGRCMANCTIANEIQAFFQFPAALRKPKPFVY